MYDRELRIETARLILRQPRMAVWRHLMTAVGSWTVMGFGMFSVLERRTGKWLGRVGATMPAGWPGSEVGWGIGRESWHQGYATEAACAAMDWVFSALDWREVIHVIAPDNAASQAVARRLGSVNRGPGRLPAPLEDSVVELWGQTREQWQVNRLAVGRR